MPIYVDEVDLGNTINELAEHASIFQNIDACIVYIYVVNMIDLPDHHDPGP